MANDSVKISLEIAEKQAISALKNIENATKSTNQIFNTFVGNLAANVATAALSKLASGISGAFGAAIQEARNAAKEVSDLNLILLNSGQYSDSTSKNLQNYANSMELVSIYSSGAITEQLGVLAAITKLDEQGLKRAQSSAIELASAYNLELGEATRLITDAFNGKTKGLEKLGIQYTDTGSKLENYNSILTQLERLNGSAASKANTFEGSMAKLSNATDAALGAFGNLIITNPIVTEGLELLSNILFSAAEGFQNFSEWAKKNKDSLEILAVGVGSVGMALASLAIYQAATAVGFTGIAGAATAAWAAITAPVTLVVAGLAAIATGAYAVYKNWAQLKALFTGDNSALIEQAEKEAQIKIDAEKAISETTKNEYQKRAAIKSEAQIKEEEDLNKYVQKLAKQATDIDSINKQKLESLKLFYEEKGIVEQDSLNPDFENQLAREQEYLSARREMLDAEVLLDIERVNSSSVSAQDKENALLAIQIEASNKRLALQNEFSKKELDIKIKQKELEKKINEQTLTATSDFFGSMADFASLHGKEAFESQKKFASSEAIISAYLAINRTMASLPFPANLISSAAIGIKAMANVERINTMSAPSFEFGGIVPGNSFSGDKIMARVNSGEMILNKQGQSNLFNTINNGGGMGNNVEPLLIELINAVKSSSKIEIDGREVFNVVKNQIDIGRNL